MKKLLCIIVTLAFINNVAGQDDHKKSDLEKELKSFFQIKFDKFDMDQATWYTPKGALPIKGHNSIYCYFSTIGGVPGNFRMVIKTVGEDWLFVDGYQFYIDGKPYEFKLTGRSKSDYIEGSTFEWTDDSIGPDDLPLIEALSNAKKAEIKINGDTYYDTRHISKYEIDLIYNTLYYYREMGGTF